MAVGYKLEFYVPVSAAAAVKRAVFAAGGGRWGQYAECCWQTAGCGEFRPLPGSAPAIGRVGEPERVEELKVELLVTGDCRDAVIAALRGAHPYETPAFYCWQVELA